jgi:uncharacterized protein GlcG (DUF336 family)
MFHPSDMLKGPAIAAMLIMAAPAAQAQTDNLTSAQAMAAMHAVLDFAGRENSNPSIAIIDRDGRTILLLRGDNASPHNIGLAQRKAYTALTFKMPSIEWRDKSKPGMPDADQRSMPRVIPLGGGYPITVGNTVIGGIGVSGTRGGQPGDTAAAKAGADAAAQITATLTTAQK